MKASQRRPHPADPASPIAAVSDAVVVATNVGSSSFAWRERGTFAAGTEAHYYVRIKMADNQNVWTGPVYVKYDPAAVTAVGDGNCVEWTGVDGANRPVKAGIFFLHFKSGVHTATQKVLLIR